ncbi:hypothetical protein AURDEDRAFT_166519 [Auricularia subglabra TFB-10046 SS5]|nr:hypothetical protein AURDEDRAFT_166519 [Auricularia subglabra TFB-10046 SS5]
MSLQNLHALSVDSTLLHVVCRAHPRELAHVTLHLHELDIGLNSRAESPLGASAVRHRSVYAWQSLIYMSELPNHLESLTLEVHPLDNELDADDAHELLGVIEGLGTLDLPIVRIRGFPKDVIKELGDDAAKTRAVSVAFAF